MISWEIFLLISTFVYMPILYILRKWHISAYRISYIGNRISLIVLMFIFDGFYGNIFKGGALIKTFNLMRTSQLQIIALIFCLLYAFAFIKYCPRW